MVAAGVAHIAVAVAMAVAGDGRDCSSGSGSGDGDDPDGGSISGGYRDDDVQCTMHGAQTTARMRVQV